MEEDKAFFGGMILMGMIWFFTLLFAGHFWDYSNENAYVVVNIERSSLHAEYELQYCTVNGNNSTFIRLRDGHPSISQFAIGDTLKLVPIKLLREKGIRNVQDQ